MRLLISTIIFLLMSSSAWATTYYVRTNGGTNTRCTGLVDAADPGSGTAQPCAFSHPLYAKNMSTATPAGAFTGGDTLIIDGYDYNNGGAQAKYEIGYNAMPGTATGCTSGAKYDCLWIIPGGSDSAHPTRILGKGYDTLTGNKPQLWGSGALYWALMYFSAGTNNVELQYLDLTDHEASQIGPNHPALTYPFSNGARRGIYSDNGDNFLLKSVDIHGFAQMGIFFPSASNWTFYKVRLNGNGGNNIDNDQGRGISSDQMSGVFIMTLSSVKYAGCVEDYPFNNFAIASGSCVGQGGYDQFYQGQGDGFGAANGSIGNWIITDSVWAYNTQDGFDGLHGDGTGYVKIIRSLFEGDSGAEIKTINPLYLENSFVIGNCGYHAGTGLVYNESATSRYPTSSKVGSVAAGSTVTGATSGATATVRAAFSNGDFSGNIFLYNVSGTFQAGEQVRKDVSNYAVISSGTPGTPGDAVPYCRADATLSLFMQSDVVHRIINSTIFSNHNQAIDVVNYSCNANSKFYMYNSILYNGREFMQDTSNPYPNLMNGSTPAGNNLADAYYSFNGSGSTCVSPIGLTEDYNIFYNTKDGAADATGAHSRYTNPLLSGTIKTGPSSGPDYFYSTDAYLNFYLGSSSPARYAITGSASADETVSCVGDCTMDYNHNQRGANWDGGAAKYGSSALTCASNLGYCGTNSDCCSNACLANTCVSSLPLMSGIKLQGSIKFQ